ncbi:MAG TPA: hypothetical protein VJ464_12625 [Blastocatellia bacterium]|nr:hypothetical protein [Blastocatellia bacterium]
MRSLGKPDWSRLAWLAVLVICLISCRRRPDAAIAEIIAAGEPDVYAATVTRLAVDGEARETTSGSVARRGDWRREQWTEAGAARALILRPDLGKGYLLDLDHRLYVEFDSGTAVPAAAAHDAASPASESAPPAISLEEVERALSDAPAPVQVALRVLGDETIEDHPCQVIEERATFADGRVEVTRSRRARDLSGLPLLIEVESPNGARLTTERRGIRLDVSPDDFAVPAGFRKIDQLPAAKK